MNLAPITFEIYPLPIPEFREKILDLYRPPMRSRTTFVSMRRALDLLGELPGVATTADLTTATIAKFCSWRHGRENPNTTRSHLRRISSACTIAAAEGWLRVSPFSVRKGWVRGVTPKVPQIHSRAEIARVLTLADREHRAARGPMRFKAGRLRVMLAIAAYTGMRRMEVLTLRVEDVALEARMIDLKARVGGQLKTDAAAQLVPMPEALASILGPWALQLRAEAEALAADRLPGEPRRPDYGWLLPNCWRTAPWTSGSPGYRPGDMLQALGRRAGVEGLTFQSLRHSWATHAEFWGLSDAIIQRVLRHTNLRTQQRYRHAEARNLRALVGGIDFAEGPDGDADGGEVIR